MLGKGPLGVVTPFALLVAVAAAVPGAMGNSTSDVVVPRGQPVQVTFTPVTEPFLADVMVSFGNAIRMAVERHPTIKGFPIQINTVGTTCQGDNSAAAAAVVSNVQNTAVLGHVCSDGLASALPTYEAAGVVVVSGSASRNDLPALARTVFNRTVVSDGDGLATWELQVAALPSVAEWGQEYEAEFGLAAEIPSLSALYFDATSLLIKRLQRVSKVIDGNLVIDRAALAEAVRETTNYRGVTCSMSLDAATGNRINDQEALARCEQAE